MQKVGLSGLIEMRIFIKPAQKCHRINLLNSISQNVIKHKFGLLNLAAELGNVSRAGKAMGLIRILTDRGTEYCGRPEAHDYQLYLALNEIEHTERRCVTLRPTASTGGFIKPF